MGSEAGLISAAVVVAAPICAGVPIRPGETMVADAGGGAMIGA